MYDDRGIDVHQQQQQQQQLFLVKEDIFTIIVANSRDRHAVESDPFGARYAKSMSDRHPRQQLTTEEQGERHERGAEPCDARRGK